MYLLIPLFIQLSMTVISVLRDKSTFLAVLEYSLLKPFFFSVAVTLTQSLLDNDKRSREPLREERKMPLLQTPNYLTASPPIIKSCASSLNVFLYFYI